MVDDARVVDEGTRVVVVVGTVLVVVEDVVVVDVVVEGVVVGDDVGDGEPPLRADSTSAIREPTT